MASWLLDTNVLLRVQESDPDCSDAALAAVSQLMADSQAVYITPQVVVEFWCAATRPCDVNGLGWDCDTAAARVEDLLDRFEMLNDCPAVFDAWRAVVQTHGVRGKHVHDARLVAVMLAHGVENMLTFNVDDFKGFDEINVVRPESVI